MHRTLNTDLVNCIYQAHYIRKRHQDFLRALSESVMEKHSKITNSNWSLAKPDSGTQHYFVIQLTPYLL